MQEMTSERKNKIKEILKNPNAENRLIEIKKYLAPFSDEIQCDYAQLAYNIYLENLNPKKQ